MPQVFRNKRHDGVNESEGRLESGVNGVLNALLDVSRCLVCGERLGRFLQDSRSKQICLARESKCRNVLGTTYDEDITQLVQPESVDRLGGFMETPGLECLVDLA